MFSIVIPTLNRSDMLDRALSSVSKQTDPDCEIVVVDDGSSEDEAARIAASVAATSRARLVVQPRNGGASCARNAGVAASTGEVVAFLDSDDWWMPERLSRHRALFLDPQVVASYNSAKVSRLGVIEKNEWVGRPPPSGFAPAISLAGWNYIGGCSLMCVRRTAFDAVGGFDTKLPAAEDWDLWIKIAQLGDIRFVNEHLGYYDAGPHTRLTTSHKKIIDAHEEIYRRAAMIPQTSKEKRYVAALHHWIRSEIALQFGEGRTSLQELAISILTRPIGITIRRSRTLVPEAAAAVLHKLLSSGTA